MERGQRTQLSAWRSAHLDALRLTRALQDVAAVFRRHAGTLKYHPQVGLAGKPGADLLEAAAVIREHLTALAAHAGRWDEEITWLRSLDEGASLDTIQRGHAAAREAIGLLRAALEIFDRAVLYPEVTRLDAPYGTGAPRRVHPGAQCTWVAGRAEEVARWVSGVTLHKEQLLLNVRSA